MRPDEFRDRVGEQILNLLWSQWGSIGIPGSGSVNKEFPIDPEALIAFSCHMSRYDARLFDQIMDWVRRHERLVNLNRLRSVIDAEKFGVENILAPIAVYLDRATTTKKWEKVMRTTPRYPNADLEPLFLFFDGTGLPTVQDVDPVFERFGFRRNLYQDRGLAGMYKPEGLPGLLIKLRALFGIAARAEILLFMLCKDRTTVTDVADNTYYSWRLVQNVLSDMSASGLVISSGSKRTRHYSLPKEAWKSVLGIDQTALPPWVNWPVLYKSCMDIWDLATHPAFPNFHEFARVSELSYLMLRVAQRQAEKNGIMLQIPAMNSLEEILIAFSKLIGVLSGTGREA